jgi:hypothetical protein
MLIGIVHPGISQELATNGIPGRALQPQFYTGMNITPIFWSYGGKRAGNAHQQCHNKQVKFKPFHKNYLMVNKDPGSSIGVATHIF